MTVVANAARLVEVFTYHQDAEAHTRPWKLGAWLWATEGHFVVALADDGTAADPTPENRLKGRRYLEEKPDDLAPVSVRALRAFAGAADAPNAKCASCDGDGYDDSGEFVKCEHCHESTRLECQDCGGDGLAGLSYRLGGVAGVPLNLTLLAYALTFVPDDEAAAIGSMEVVSRGLVSRALIVMAPTWRVVVMSVTEPMSAMPSVFYCTGRVSA